LSDVSGDAAANGGGGVAESERLRRRRRSGGGSFSKALAPSIGGSGGLQDQEAAAEDFRPAGVRGGVRGAAHHAQQRHVTVHIPSVASSGESEALLHARRIEAAGRGAPASAGQVTSAFTLLVVWPAVQFCVGGIYCFTRGALIAFTIVLVHHWLEAGLQPVEVAVYCSIILIYTLLPAAGRVSNLYAY
jgi:hypothetical protein